MAPGQDIFGSSPKLTILQEQLFVAPATSVFLSPLDILVLFLVHS